MKTFFTSEKKGDVTVVRLSFNEINLEEREDLKNELQQLMDEDGGNYIIDLSKVGFVSSLVIATILFFAKEVKRNNGQVKISGLSTEAQSIFQLTKLDKVFELYAKEEEALASFS